MMNSVDWNVESFSLFDNKLLVFQFQVIIFEANSEANESYKGFTIAVQTNLSIIAADGHFLKVSLIT